MSSRWRILILFAHILLGRIDIIDIVIYLLLLLLLQSWGSRTEIRAMSCSKIIWNRKIHISCFLYGSKKLRNATTWDSPTLLVWLRLLSNTYYYTIYIYHNIILDNRSPFVCRYLRVILEKYSNFHISSFH